LNEWINPFGVFSESVDQLAGQLPLWETPYNTELAAGVV
jgi:hypothetical protein